MFCKGIAPRYGTVKTTEYCVHNEDIDGRNNCTSDVECLKNGRKLCDVDPGCLGIAWYEPKLQQPLKLCGSTKMKAKNDGWRTMMKEGI